MRARSRTSLALLLLLLVIAAGVVATLAVRGHHHHPLPKLDLDSPGFPREIPSTDGSRLRLAEPPRRIIALSLPVEEILLDCVSPTRLVGVTPFACDPEYSHVATLAREVGNVVRASGLEKILSLEPDLVFAASYTDRSVVRKLRESGVSTCVLPEVRTSTDIERLVRLIAHAVGADHRGDELVTASRQILARTQELGPGPSHPRGSRKRPGVLYLFSASADVSDAWTAGVDTVIDEMIRAAGGRNVAAEHGVDKEALVSAESILRWKPDWLLLPGADPERLRRSLVAHPVFAGLDAVGGGRVIVLPIRDLTCTSHFWANTVNELRAILWPNEAQ